MNGECYDNSHVETLYKNDVKRHLSTGHLLCVCGGGGGGGMLHKS